MLLPNSPLPVPHPCFSILAFEKIYGTANRRDTSKKKSRLDDQVSGVVRGRDLVVFGEATIFRFLTNLVLCKA